jgi:muconolactone delta-isomerase
MPRVKVSELPEGMRAARKRRLKANIQKRNFTNLDTAGRFKMIIREPDQYHARILFAQLSEEDQLDFLRDNYRGFTVKHSLTEVEALRIVPTIRLVKAGFNLSVTVRIREKNFSVTLARYPERPTSEQVLHKIQHHLPTVKIL